MDKKYEYLENKSEYIKIELAKLSVLPQVRNITNSRINELADDIRTNGLIHPISIARLTQEEFKNYIDFVNQLWRKNVKIENYQSYNEYYYLVIAGHSRLKALQKIEEEDKINIKWQAQIHHVNDNKGILSIQLGENIHEAVNQERRAIAIVETYRYGLINGEWLNKEEFIKKNPKFSKQILKEALLFADLPVDVQEYIFQGTIFYKVGVELGRLHPLIIKYISSRMGGVENLNQEKFEAAIDIYYAEIQMRLYEVKSVKRGLEILKGYQTTMEYHFMDSKDVQQLYLDMFEASPYEQGEAFLKEIIKSYREAKAALTTKHFNSFKTMLSADSQLTGDNNIITTLAVNSLQSKFVNEYFSDEETDKAIKRLTKGTKK